MRADPELPDHRVPLSADPTPPSPHTRPEWRVASSDGVSLAVHDLGPDGPRPILLTHATGFHGWVWAPVARHLSGFHAWAPDLRGHGDSSTPAGRPMEWDGFTDDVLAVVDDLRARGSVAGPLVAAGHSKGGAALLLAEQRRPGTFAALFLYEPVVFPEGFRPPGPNPLAEGARRRRSTFASRDEAFANYAAKPPFDVLDPEALRAYVDHGFVDRPDGTVELACEPEIEAQVYENAALHRAFTRLGEVACPVTVAAGSVDTDGGVGPGSIAPELAAALPRGRFVRYPELGHFGPLEDPARIAAGIAEAVTPQA